MGSSHTTYILVVGSTKRSPEAPTMINFAKSPIKTRKYQKLQCIYRLCFWSRLNTGDSIGTATTVTNEGYFA